nr:hypothetical protein [Sinisalibacter aestuarii]
MDAPGLRVGPGGPVGPVAPGKNLVRMAADDRVDPRDAGKREQSVFHPRAVRGRADAGMGEDHHQIGAERAQLRHGDFGRGHDIADFGAEGAAAKPGDRAGRQKTKKPDRHLMGLAGGVGQPPLDQGEGLRGGDRARPGRPGARHQRQVGDHHRKGRMCQNMPQIFGAVVEIVVAERDRIDPERGHGGDDGVTPTQLAAAPHHIAQHRVAHRIAVQKVAIVEQQRVIGLRPRGADQRCGARQPGGDRGHVRQIIVGQDVHMHIRCRHKAQFNPWQRVAGALPSGRCHARHTFSIAPRP